MKILLEKLCEKYLEKKLLRNFLINSRRNPKETLLKEIPTTCNSFRNAWKTHWSCFMHELLYLAILEEFFKESRMNFGRNPWVSFKKIFLRKFMRCFRRRLKENYKRIFLKKLFRISWWYCQGNAWHSKVIPASFGIISHRNHSSKSSENLPWNGNTLWKRRRERGYPQFSQKVEATREIFRQVLWNLFCNIFQFLSLFANSTDFFWGIHNNFFGNLLIFINVSIF